MPDGKIIVGTDQGQIVICAPSGEVSRILGDYPGEDFYIEKILPYKHGFIIVGNKGQMIVYTNNGSEPSNPFQQIAQLPNINDDKLSEEQKQIISAVSNSKIKSIDISSGEDMLIFTTDNNQIYKMTVSLMDKSKVEAFYFYLV